MKILGFIMLVLSCGSMALQYNDPDPLRWVALYAATTLFTLLFLLGRTPRLLPLLLAALALGWSFLVLPDVRASRFAWNEVLREWLGLLLIGAWMIAVERGARRGRRIPHGAHA